MAVVLEAVALQPSVARGQHGLATILLNLVMYRTAVAAITGLGGHAPQLSGLQAKAGL
jgi:hypothetical protein